MIPWIIFAVVVVPLVIVAFGVTRRKSSGARTDVVDDETERQFADAEAYEAEWHEDDEKRYHDDRLP